MHQDMVTGDLGDDFSQEIEQMVGSLEAQVDERRRAVEGKLFPLLGLTSALSAGVTASLVAASTVDKVRDGVPFFVVAVSAFYAIIQLLRAVSADLSGIERQAYKQLTMASISPRDAETAMAYRCRIMNLRTNHAQMNQWVVDQKVSQMALSHRALRNALCTIPILAVTAMIVALVRLFV